MGSFGQKPHVVHPSFHPSIHPSIYPSIYPIYPSIYSSVNYLYLLRVLLLDCLIRKELTKIIPEVLGKIDPIVQRLTLDWGLFSENHGSERFGTKAPKTRTRMLMASFGVLASSPLGFRSPLINFDYDDPLNFEIFVSILSNVVIGK